MQKARLVVPAALLFLPLSILGCEAQSAGQLPPSESAVMGECEPGFWYVAGECVPAEEAFTGDRGHAYWVDQSHPRADDTNPGTQDLPWKTINRASTVLRPGDAVVVREGIYRESITPRTGGTHTDRRVTYAAYPGEEVVVSGADVSAAAEWSLDGTAWRRPWTGPVLPTFSEETDRVMRRELVVVDGRMLRAVFDRDDLEPGTFFVEGDPESPRSLVVQFEGHVSPDAAGLIEIAHRSFLFRPTGTDPHPECGDAHTPGFLRVVGLTFRHAANRAQWGAFCGGREGALVEDVTVEWTNGAGVDGSGRNHIFRRVAANRNGQIGFVVSCDGCLFEDSEAIGNNWKGYDPFWEAGGGKWHR
ncbi:MAG: hypothetical protein R3284_09960, partial [Rubricoccaceae bacterium]|nr:hypothetical protein [Rubricoccaceae bacterium]